MIDLWQLFYFFHFYTDVNLFIISNGCVIKHLMYSFYKTHKKETAYNLKMTICVNE